MDFIRKIKNNKLKLMEYQKVRTANKKLVSIAFVGQTGTGKSTLQAAIIDYIKGVKFADRNVPKKLQPHGRAETKEALITLASNAEFEVKLIDTPGMNDTEGLMHDKLHLAKIVKTLIEAHEFHAICFVLQKGNNRSTTDIKYAIAEIKKILTKDVNLMTVVTHESTPGMSDDLKAVITNLELPVQNVSFIDNYAYEKVVSCSKDDEQEITEKQMESYNKNKPKLEKILLKVSECKLFQSKKIQELDSKRQNLTLKIYNLTGNLQDCLNYEQKLKDIQNEILLAQRDKEKFANYNFDVVVQVIDENRISNYCSSCGGTCKADYGTGPLEIIRVPLNFLIGDCTRCKHSNKNHKSSKTIFTKRDENKTITNYDLQSSYFNACSQEDKAKQVLQLISQKLDEEKMKRKALQQEIWKAYDEINSFALIGHNYHYEDYLNEKIDYFEKDFAGDDTQRKASLEFLRNEKKDFQNFKKAIAKDK